MKTFAEKSSKKEMLWKKGGRETQVKIHERYL